MCAGDVAQDSATKEADAKGDHVVEGTPPAGAYSSEAT